jgi:TatD DNase family protein
MPKYIDIHSHLNLSQFDSDREDVVQKLKDENISTITVGADYKTSVLAVELGDKHENLYASVGLHPSDVLIEEFNYDQILNLAINKKVVAIGECGLDYFRSDDEEFKNKQKEIFNLHIKLALEVGKPLMIHARASKGTMDAYNDVLDILESYQKPARNADRIAYARPHDSFQCVGQAGGDNPKLNANFHFFAGDINIAKRIVKNSFSISFDGPITFSNDYDEVIKEIGLESIMAETDSPFAAPMPYRGKRCEPQMVKEVIKRIAELKEMSIEETNNIILNNIKRVFGI